MNIDLKSKVAIITGAGSGIGRATALLLSRCGAKLALMDKNEKTLNETVELCQKEGSKHVVRVVGDVTRQDSLENLVRETMEQHKRIDILVNNASQTILCRNLMETNMEDLHTIMQSNVKSLMSLTKLCVPHLKETKGTIINVSSIAPDINAHQNLTYTLSKAAVDQLTRCLALDLAGDGITVNGVKPGDIKAHLRQERGESKHRSDTHCEDLLDRHPLKRLARYEDVANTICFLSSEMASCITGESICIDGGLSKTTAQ